MIFGVNADTSVSERTFSTAAPAPAMMMPLDGADTLCLPGNVWAVTVVGTDQPVGLIVVAIRGDCGLHISLDADALRAMAANAIRAADMLDGGRGVS